MIVNGWFVRRELNSNNSHRRRELVLHKRSAIPGLEVFEFVRLWKMTVEAYRAVIDD